MASWEGVKDWFLGGTSKKPGDESFKPPPLEHQTQIDEAIRRGLATNYTAPQATMDGQFRNAQTQQLGQLQRIASGQDKGAGELAAMRGAQAAAAGQQAMARMARGSGAAMAARQAANNTAAIGLSGAGQAQEAALRDQQAAQGLLTQAASAGRGQDQAVQLANMDAQLKTMGMNDQARLAYLAQLTGMDMAQLQQRMAAYDRAQQSPGSLGPILSAGGQIGAAAVASDERLKTEIEDAGEDIDEMLDRLVAKRYRYKDESRYGKGARPGVIAQDLMRSRAGAEIVRTDPDGMMIDTGKAISAALASVARLNERLRALEDHEDDEEDDDDHEMGPPRPVMIIRRALGAH